jgi:hypothetical protein
MDEADIPKTAIITPFGLFEFLFMPFGLAIAAQTFQRLMNSSFRSFPFVFVYLDHLLIFSKSRSEHLVHLEQILSILAENGLHINPDKFVRSGRGHFPWLSGHSPRPCSSPFPWGTNYGLSPICRCQILATFPRHGQFLPPLPTRHCPYPSSPHLGHQRQRPPHLDSRNDPFLSKCKILFGHCSPFETS